MPQPIQPNSKWRVVLPDESIIWPRFEPAWLYAMPDAGEGWFYLPKAAAVQQFITGQRRVCVAWRPNEQIYLEWF